MVNYLTNKVNKKQTKVAKMEKVKSYKEMRKNKVLISVRNLRELVKLLDGIVESDVVHIDAVEGTNKDVFNIMFDAKFVI